MRHHFFCIDGHTAGNPVRLVAGGAPLLQGANMIERRQEFASDNTAGLCPEAGAALQDANAGAAAAYGDDEWTQRLCDRVRELFEIDCDVFLVSNGTAANALALAQLCQPFHSVICHEYAHIDNDECGACEFYTGGSKLIPTPGTKGKIDLREVEAALTRQHELHSHKPRVISLAQATEVGTVYVPDEVREISAFANKRGMFLHMDGARFANAIAILRCAPKEITWRAGVEVLCFGGTKNGLAAGELVEINADVLRTATEQARMATLNKGAGDLIWPGLMRRLDRLDPGYRH